ncbi:cellulose binding domain-containing protein [Glycomyces sp. TRM65418]|uniref:rhamnogalacturonan lyase family protein n=1 Tax=Glycomyces sp. TRM65418 TaxID=2867006 RepID=UPI001CE6E958|nr:cellulose binding domain-containing protein [Glycomyces sp. TRM65418]MCC3762818.1 cellulose binding domain-containing protein [Glycomyces sp. TRM65418]QZD56848.1 cellulose binding domain-containing protein [Glycomyces sp. TRM65418]
MTPPPRTPRWRRALAVAAAGATALAGVLTAGAPAQAQDDGITVYLASDSTVQTYDPYWEPQAGWGQVIDRYFDENVTVANHAIGGRSSRSFVEQGRLDAILNEIQPGDYLFVQFGHNDATASVPERYTPPDDYKTYLRDHYIAGAVEKGAIPVLVTPVSRRSFNAETGEFNTSFPEYVQKVYELHEETGVAMVDLSASSRAYLNEIGPEEAKSVFLHVPAGVYPNRPNGTTDDTHFQEYGAIQMARLVAEETATLDLPLAEHVVDVAPPADVPAAPTGLTAATVANASVTLNWTAGEDADIYRVYVREPGGDWRLGTTATVGVGRVSGLAEDTAYEFAVAGVNAKGESAKSATLTVTTATAGFKFDFGPASQTVAPGYAEVNRGTAYTAERGYGFTTDMTGAIDRDRGGDADPVGRDFVAWFGGSYDFAVDVADGLYSARVIVGDYVGSARQNFKFEGVDYGAANAGSRSILTKDFEGIVVEDGQLTVTVSGQTGHFNGLELTRIGDAPGSGDDGPDEPCADCAEQVENLDRAPVAVSVDGGNFVSWRSLPLDPEGTAFNVYRDGRLITPEPTQLTNLTDQGGTPNATYWISTVTEGVETGFTKAFEVWDEQYIDIDMDRPEGGTTPDGVEYTYSPNDATVADLNGDGVYEIVQKWDPSNAKDNSRSGYTGNVYVDAYTLSGERLWRIDLGVNIRAGAHYTQLVAYDLDSDGKAEVALKTADGTVDGEGTVIGDADADWRGTDGRILQGPEFLTIFNGQTGAAMETADFAPARGDMCSWGDCYGNRGDRLMAAVAYLDGKTPSLITNRGIYAKSEITAWNWDGDNLPQVWNFSSDRWGGAYAGQGNHQMSIADVDADGRDEIVFGAMTVNDDGTPLYSTGLGHGDALHVSDFDPSNDGLEIFSPFECMSCSGDKAAAMRDADTAEVLWSVPGTRDTGRGTCGDIDPNHAGAECWAVSTTGAWDSREGALHAADGTLIGNTIPSANSMVWWDGDLGREIFDHEFNEPDYVPVHPFIAEWDPETGQQEEIFTPEGVHTNNGTKGNAVITGDLLGDWREEVVLRKESNDGVRLFTTTHASDHALPTLMNDPQYRLAVSWQNVSYNQPPWPSFFLGYDMEAPQWEAITTTGPARDAEAPPYAGASCEVAYRVVSDHGRGFVVQIKVTNTGDAPIGEWDLVWKSGGVETVAHAWGGDIAIDGDAMRADPAFWNSPLKSGHTKQIGFQGTGDPGDPGMFLMNGQVCARA